jgi:hypothetical protein
MLFQTDRCKHTGNFTAQQNVICLSLMYIYGVKGDMIITVHAFTYDTIYHNIFGLLTQLLCKPTSCSLLCPHLRLLAHGPLSGRTVADVHYSGTKWLGRCQCGRAAFWAKRPVNLRPIRTYHVVPMSFPCRSPAIPLPCRSAKGLDCVFPV